MMPYIAAIVTSKSFVSWKATPHVKSETLPPSRSLENNSRKLLNIHFVIQLGRVLHHMQKRSMAYTRKGEMIRTRS